MGRRDDEHQWAIGDLNLVLAFLALLLLAGIDARFGWLALAALVVAAAVLLRRYVLRRRRERANAGKPFWVDDLRGR